MKTNPTNIAAGDFGLRWQSAAATPLCDCGQRFQSGVALRFPPQSKWGGRGFAVLRSIAAIIVSFLFAGAAAHAQVNSGSNGSDGG